MEFFHRVMEEFASLVVQLAIGLQQAMGHLGVGAAFWFCCEALVLDSSGLQHPLANGFG